MNALSGDALKSLLFIYLFILPHTNKRAHANTRTHTRHCLVSEPPLVPSLLHRCAQSPSRSRRFSLSSAASLVLFLHTHTYTHTHTLQVGAAAPGGRRGRLSLAADPVTEFLKSVRAAETHLAPTRICYSSVCICALMVPVEQIKSCFFLTSEKLASL